MLIKVCGKSFPDEVTWMQHKRLSGRFNKSFKFNPMKDHKKGGFTQAFEKEWVNTTWVGLLRKSLYFWRKLFCVFSKVSMSSGYVKACADDV